MNGRQIDSFLHCERFDPAKLSAAMPFVDIHYLASTDSTNDRAISHARRWELATPAAQTPPALFVTDQQTQGRGRGNHRWFSGPGALTFSILAPRPLPLDSPWSGLIPLAMADSVCEAIGSRCQTECSIKWPNDIMLDDRKLGGILIESPDSRWMVAGIGLNVNNDSGEIDRAISLIDRCGHSIDRVPLLTEIVSQAIAHLQAMAGTGDSVDCQWKSALLKRCRRRDWLRNKFVSCHSGGDAMGGMAAGLAEDGSLMLQLVNGSTKSVRSGQIKVLGG
jgi:BirA family transcriptional regulator, biotin operon repressor / biotin---[acetyl-CoA-carboxylase] ligase